ncbi:MULTISPECIES: SRPBCC family protein [Actinomadura]|uniref:Aromatase n=1 Tax=Actinomadura litoris TaxID=2678616 RepID=A0A7K1L108_9ACTN|nr:MULTISPECIES: SRPBCC family protein [Actinomadura]MBT2206906.1 SRPBCC family protein [Actinomadura sp. NEAU-AAG7]MUN37993.1 aromatase [Actinomadura litoris]
MPSTQQQIDHGVVVDAGYETVFDLVADVGRWPQFHLSAVHAEVLHSNEKGDLIQHWALDGDSTVRTWRTVRRSDRAGRRITFSYMDADPPDTEVRGEWVFTELAPDRTRVELRHTIEGPARADLGPLLDGIGLDGKEHLDTLRDTAERRAELDDLVVSFTDPLFIAGSVEDAYEYLYRADLWPERIPHVVGLDLTEDVPNVQFFDMDTKSPDGTTHSVRSVRICLPPNLIVYKQISLPAVLDAHTGHWRFTETREGVVAESRHSSTIKPSAVSQLGGGTVDGARRYLRRLLSGHSMTNLRLTKTFAEERAGLRPGTDR